MKLLIYGTGVIGSCTIHELCQAGHDVTVVARGRRQEMLAGKGICVRIGKKEWTDHPRVISAYDGENYDVTFSIMQNQQQETVLETLAGIHTAKIVLVGNNMTSSQMEERLRGLGVDAEQIFFGFQTTGGNRYEDYTEVVTFGRPTMTLGRLHGQMSGQDQTFFREVFGRSDMKLEFMDDMDAWYKCHMAFILPIANLAYAHHCDLRECSLRDMQDYMTAGTEVYGLYQTLGIPIRPVGDEKNTRGLRKFIYAFSMWIMGKGKMGEQAVTNHCRNAVEEMRYMDAQMELLRSRKPEYPMPVYDRLRNARPD